MGLRYRKSINLGGGFRINISKSGIGYSWGVPGFRVTKTAKGTTRKTYSIPGTGISYVEEHEKTNTNKDKFSPQDHTASDKSLGATKELDIGEIQEFQTAEYQELLDKISKYKKWNLLANILLLTFILFFYPFFIITGCIGIALKIYVKQKMSIPLVFSFDDESRAIYENTKAKWKALNTSKQLWQLITSTSVKDGRYNAGASSLVTRYKIRFSESCPAFFKSDEKFVSLKLKNETFYFMPDKLLIIKGNSVGAISYDNLKITGSEYRFIESDSVPSDTKIIGQTWAKVNKDGSPDKRFKGNRQLPICQYGLIKISTDTGMDIRICCSNYALSKSF